MSENQGFLRGPAAREVLAGLAVLLAGFLVHAQALGFGFTWLDDQSLVLRAQSRLTDPSFALTAFREDAFHVEPSRRYYYRPVLTLSFMLDAALGGPSPFVYHLTNLVLHLACAWLVRRTLLRLGASWGWSLFLGAVFAVHPAFAGVASWIPGRNDSLLALFVLLAFGSFLRFLETDRSAPLTSHLVCWSLALLAKETAVLLPVLCALHAVLVARSARLSPKRIVLVSGWALLGGVYLFARAAALSNPEAPGSVDLLRSLAANSAAFLYYVRTAFVPVGLSVYPGLDDARPLVGAVILAGVGLLAARACRVHGRWLLFGGLWFFLFLVPSVAVPSAWAAKGFFDGRMYVPFLGLGVLLPRLIPERAVADPRLRWGLAVTVLALLAMGTVVQARDYRDRLSFWKSAAASSPRAAFIRLNLGEAYAAAGAEAEALSEHRVAWRLDPEDPAVQAALDRAYSRLGVSEERRAALEGEVALDPGNWVAWYWLGACRSFVGDLAGAARAWEKVIQLNPEYPRAYPNLILHYHGAGDAEKAARLLEEASRRGVTLPDFVRSRLGGAAR